MRLRQSPSTPRRWPRPTRSGPSRCTQTARAPTTTPTASTTVPRVAGLNEVHASATNTIAAATRSDAPATPSNAGAVSASRAAAVRRCGAGPAGWRRASRPPGCAPRAPGALRGEQRYAATTDGVDTAALAAVGAVHEHGRGDHRGRRHFHGRREYIRRGEIVQRGSRDRDGAPAHRRRRGLPSRLIAST